MGWCFAYCGKFPKVFSVAFTISLILSLGNLLAVSIYCGGVGWVTLMLQCDDTFYFLNETAITTQSLDDILLNTPSNFEFMAGNKPKGPKDSPKYDKDLRSKFSFQLPCYNDCTASKVDTAFDIFCVNVFLGIVWLATQLIYTIYADRMKNEVSGGKEYLSNIEKQIGKQPAPQRQKIVKHNTVWQHELVGWRRRKNLSKASFEEPDWLERVFFFFMFWCVATAIMYLVITVSPKRFPVSSLDMSLFDIVNIDVASPYDYLMVFTIFLEIAFFSVTAMLITWPSPSIVRKHAAMWEDGLSKDGHLSDEQFGLIPDTCLCIACHDSCLTEERAITFKNTLRNALTSFPPYAIFVCDNGREFSPSDFTEEEVKKISREAYPDADYNPKHMINYLFIPEGNKSHAAYWVTEYWIPEMHRNGMIPDFQYMLLIDDDVPLPNDLHVPLATLEKYQRIKSVSYAISGSTESGDSNWLVNLQDAEYKIMGLMKQFQSRLGTVFYCHGAIGLWRREILGKQVLWNHNTVFDGEDLYMGLLLHRMHKNYSIIFQSGSIVPTYAPEDGLTLFRQRTHSWDLCSQRNTLVYLWEFIYNWSGFRLIILKPFLLYELLTIFCDWTRIYLLAGMAHHDIVGLIFMFIFFYAILWIQLLIFNYHILSERPELRLDLTTVIFYPPYRTFSTFFRLIALLVNSVEYPSTRLPNSISKRETKIRDIPPCPHISPKLPIDWFTIWHPMEETPNDSNSLLIEKTTKLINSMDLNLDAIHSPFRLRYLLIAMISSMKVNNRSLSQGKVSKLWEELEAELRIVVTNIISRNIDMIIHDISDLIPLLPNYSKNEEFMIFCIEWILSVRYPCYHDPAHRLVNMARELKDILPFALKQKKPTQNEVKIKKSMISDSQQIFLPFEVEGN